MQPVSRERNVKHILAAKNTQTTREEPVYKQRISKHNNEGIIGTVSSLQSVQSGCKEEFR
jgi:hypothetical protein